MTFPCSHYRLFSQVQLPYLTVGGMGDFQQSVRALDRLAVVGIAVVPMLRIAVGHNQASAVALIEGIAVVEPPRA